MDADFCYTCNPSDPGDSTTIEYLDTAYDTDDLEEGDIVNVLNPDTGEMAAWVWFSLGWAFMQNGGFGGPSNHCHTFIVCRPYPNTLNV